jgi:hypothetical protein
VVRCDVNIVEMAVKSGAEQYEISRHLNNCAVR